MNDMNFLVFDKNLFNSLKVGGFQNIYYYTKDSSIFHIENEDLLHYMNWTDFSDISYARCALLGESLTILYSFCPVEICGLYASVSFFRDKGIEIYVSRPQFQNIEQDIISYSDCSLKEIISLVNSNKVKLSTTQIGIIFNDWDLIIQKQSNLRIWNDHNIKNVDDEYFDEDIRYVLQHNRGYKEVEILTKIQLWLRRKYHFGLNPKYIKWRILNI